MPVEIKELVIRAVVERERETPDRTTRRPPPGDEKQEIVEACVRQVLRILKKSRER